MFIPLPLVPWVQGSSLTIIIVVQEPIVTMTSQINVTDVCLYLFTLVVLSLLRTSYIRFRGPCLRIIQPHPGHGGAISIFEGLDEA